MIARTVIFRMMQVKPHATGILAQIKLIGADVIAPADRQGCAITEIGADQIHPFRLNKQALRSEIDTHQQVTFHQQISIAVATGFKIGKTRFKQEHAIYLDGNQIVGRQAAKPYVGPNRYHALTRCVITLADDMNLAGSDDLWLGGYDDVNTGGHFSLAIDNRQLGYIAAFSGVDVRWIG